MKGKTRINGAVFWRPELPDCSCMWKISSSKIKKNSPQLSTQKINDYVEKINDELQIYIGSTNTTPLMTATEVRAKLNKINTAATKLISKNTRHWRQKLRNQLSVADLGTHALDNLHKYIRRQDADLYALKDALQTTRNFNASETATLNILAEVKAENISKASYTDPYLATLVHKTSSIWTSLTGREPTPQNISNDSDAKMYLYAEWVQEMVIEANKHLPEFQQVKEPSEEQILQIIRPRKR
ncbi:MAG: hypothetical protein AAF244_03295 [Pseudomonadota bacterium]